MRPPMRKQTTWHISSETTSTDNLRPDKFSKIVPPAMSIACGWFFFMGVSDFYGAFNLRILLKGADSGEEKDLFGR